MDKRATIRDVALSAGVSISTVHQALNGKSGVGAETRLRIQKIAAELDYQPNQFASGLKRRPHTVAVLLPGESDNNRYFYHPIWSGIRDYLAAVDMNIECIEIPFSDTRENYYTAMQQLHLLFAEGRLEGVLTAGHIESLYAEERSPLPQHSLPDVPVVLLSADNSAISRICCVQANHDIIGRIMAELILSHIPPYGSILMCAGNPLWQAHSLVVRGFENYMNEVGATNRIYKNHTWDMSEDSYRQLYHQLCQPDIAACCSVLTQSSVLLGRAIEQSGKTGRVFAVGSDLSEQSIAFLQRGVLNNLIEKSPYAQGYLGMEYLVEYLVKGQVPTHDVAYVNSTVVFRSALPMYNTTHPLFPLI